METEANNLTVLPDWFRQWNNEVSLVANSGIQILDFQIDLKEDSRFRKGFIEKDLSDGAFELVENNDPNYQASGNEKSYTVKADRALQPFWDQWLPLPIFSKAQGLNINIGPTNWSRVRVTDVSESLKTSVGIQSIRVQIAFDTSIKSFSEEEDYLQPTDRDVQSQREFIYASSFKELTYFLRCGIEEATHGVPFLGRSTGVTEDAWVSEWVINIFDNFLSSKDENGKQINRPIDRECKFEAWARYISFLQLLKDQINVPEIRLLNSTNEQAGEHVDVDLILDVGNSRTCGLLIEEGETGSALGNVAKLNLRDLNKPEFTYDGLFQSRVEFVDQDFGPREFSRMSGRNNAFTWPSFVRFGPEASRMVQEDNGNEAFSGLSSPKRYIWDNNLFPQKWRFRNHKNSNAPPSSVASALSQLTPEGEYIPQLKQDIANRVRPHKPIQRASHPTFSKASLFGFMVAEIVTQALVQINSASYRSNQGKLHLARRLKNLVLTLPTSTSSQEQAIIRSQVNGALSLVWNRMIKSGQIADKEKPNLQLNWDEASCSHVVFLYNEVVEKYQGNISEYLDIFGKNRAKPNSDNEVASIKIVCIDVGGGTTDVMVTTFFKEGDITFEPSQEFREGFRTAGDDILKAIIEKIILPEIPKSFDQSLKTSISEKLHELFSANNPTLTASDKQTKRQFGLRIFAPIARHILETTASRREDFSISISDIYKSEGGFSATLTDYLDKPLSNLNRVPWKLENQKLIVSYKKVKEIFEELFAASFNDISEVLRVLDVDKVLLTGRPSMHPELLVLLIKCCPCLTEYIVTIHTYKTGAWYPFRNYLGQVGDPKSTVVVGAMLITLSDRNIPYIRIPDGSFSMQSTAHYIGKMERSGKILDNNIYFAKSTNQSSSDEAKITMESVMMLGSRQFDNERWVTNPLYIVDFKGNLRSRPYKITLLKRENYNDTEDMNAEDRLINEAIKEQFEIDDIENAEGDPLPKDSVSIMLRTLGFDDEYWLDSGAFETSEC